MSELPSIADRVAAGVAWLDEHDPGWWQVNAPPRPGMPDSRPIDLSALRMADPCGCVLGHRWGNYGRSPIVSGWRYGFDLGPDGPLSPQLDADAWRAAWDALTDEWARVIEARRAEDIQPCSGSDWCTCPRCRPDRQ